MKELRSVELQTNRALFRENLQRIGILMGYEISQHLVYDTKQIKTPLGTHNQPILKDEVVIVTILRAGLPLHNGFLQAFPKSENGFVSAYRKHKSDGTFEIKVGYVTCPDLTDKVLILNDPMLATGASFENALIALRPFGLPKEVHLAAVIASQPGINHLDSVLPEDSKIWVVDIDPELNADKYIVPGLGDAGDLAFGSKLQS
jgi:uracil phosphoribosyltransferase